MCAHAESSPCRQTNKGHTSHAPAAQPPLHLAPQPAVAPLPSHPFGQGPRQHVLRRLLRQALPGEPSGGSLQSHCCCSRVLTSCCCRLLAMPAPAAWDLLPATLAKGACHQPVATSCCMLLLLSATTDASGQLPAARGRCTSEAKHSLGGSLLLLSAVPDAGLLDQGVPDALGLGWWDPAPCGGCGGPHLPPRHLQPQQQQQGHGMCM